MIGAEENNGLDVMTAKSFHPQGKKKGKKKSVAPAHMSSGKEEISNKRERGSKARGRQTSAWEKETFGGGQADVNRGGAADIDLGHRGS